MIKVYGMKISGNCYKVQLICELLKIEYEWIETDGRKNETKSPSFLLKNPNGRVPIIELENGNILRESNAILYYLAEGSIYFGKDKWEEAQILEWMFFEQYSHEPYIATNRWIIRFLNQKDEKKERIAENHTKGLHALQIMENHLAKNFWFACNRFTIADLALFAYTHKADQGDYNLSEFPSIRNWISRIQSIADFAPMED
ncbi:glutathione S-transferase family protein [Leptospira sp. 'Mane']|uniref:glutathione S-transferase family protein n=1 Tax=Leptospira sp. 'Mane' TaxID=3387407 RepID=UPI00398B5C04